MKFFNRKLGIVLGAIAALIVAAVIIIPKLIDLNRYNRLITQQLEKSLGGKVRLGHISWSLAKDLHIEADGFSISNSPTFPLDLELSRIYAEVSPIPLLSKKIVIEELLLEGAVANIKLQPKSPAPDKMEEKEKPVSVPAEAPAPLPVEILIEKLNFIAGQVSIEDSLTIPEQKTSRTFKDIEIQATNLIPGEEIQFQISLRDDSKPSLGTLTAQGTFSGLTKDLTIDDPNIKLDATLSAASVDAVKPFIKNNELGQRMGGNISLTASYNGDFGEQFRVDGVLNLNDFKYQDPSDPQRALVDAEKKITYGLNFSPDRLSIEKLVLALGNLSISAQANMDNWRAKPVIQNATITADLPLKEIEPIIPWKLIGKNTGPIRDLLQQGGKIIIEGATLPDIDFGNLHENFLTLLPEVKVNARVSGISGQIMPEYPKVKDVQGIIKLENEILQIEDLWGTVGSASLPKIQATITELLEKPNIDATLKGSLVVAKVTDATVKKFLNGIGINKLDGKADMDVALKLATAHPEKFDLQGKIALQQVNFKSRLNPASVKGLNADAIITPDGLDISSLSTDVVIPADKQSKGGSFKLEFNGKLDKWRTHPTLNISNVKTSPILLASLSPAVPWDMLGENADKIKSILMAGGSISIERMVIPKIDLKLPPKKLDTFLSGINGEIGVKDVAVTIGPYMPKIEGITGKMSLHRGVFDAKDLTLRLRAATLPNLTMRVTNITKKPKITAKLKGTVQLGKVTQPNFKKLLERHGLKNLSGEGDISLSAEYDHATPSQWKADGTLVFKGIDVETHPEGIKMEGLKGSVTFSRKKIMVVTIKQLEAKVSNAPIRLEGKVTSGGKSALVIDGKAYANRVDLSNFIALAPYLQDLDLKGMLDMDVDVHYTAANPAETRLTGKMKTEGLGIHLADPDMTLKDGNSDIEFMGNGIKLNKLAFLMNDHSFSAEGQITDPKQPNIQLYVKTDELDIDRFLPAPSKKEKGSSEAAPEPQKQTAENKSESPTHKQKVDTKKLPTFARNLTAKLQIDAGKCRIRGQAFQNVKLQADYQNGVLSQYILDSEYGGGLIKANGSADLRNLNKVAFSIDPSIKNVPMASIGTFIEGYKPSIEGPFSVSGTLKGTTGSAMDLIASLQGNLKAETGPGRLTTVGPGGRLLSTILSFLNIQGVIPSILDSDYSREGIAFQLMEASAAFDKGNVNIDNYRFTSSGLNMVSRGSINFVNQQLK